MKNLYLYTLLAVMLSSEFSGCEKKEASVIPSCVSDLIKDIEAAPVTNPSGSVWQYTYKGKTVYYIPSICCDIPSRLIDTDCKLICSPDGGFTGAGDGKCADFFSDRTDEKLIWQDPRK